MWIRSDEGVILNSGGDTECHSELLDILASENPVVSRNSVKGAPKARGRGRGRGRGSAANRASNNPVEGGMIDLSMYADKAAQLSSPLSKKAGVKIRAPSPSLLPPRPPAASAAGSSGGSQTYNTNDPNTQIDDASVDLKGIPNGMYTLFQSMTTMFHLN